MQITHSHSLFKQVLGEVFGHLLGQSRDQDTIAHRDSLVHLIHQIVNLTLRWLNDDFRIHKTGWAHDLFNHLRRNPEFVGTGCCRQEDTLIDPFDDFFKMQGSIITSARQAKTVIDQDVFTATVPSKLTVQLRNCNMAFIDDQQKVFREVIDQREWRFTWLATINMH